MIHLMSIVDALVNDETIKTPVIMAAFRSIERRDFILSEYQLEADVNAPLPIGHGQTISQPFTVASMLEWLQPQPGDRVLDIGSGSGWQTALLAHIVSQQPGGKVVAIERIPELKALGEKNIEKYGFVSSGVVHCLVGDGALGAPDYAPYQRIIAAAAAPQVPALLKEQLALGGRLVMPIGNEWSQAIVVVDKTSNHTYKEQRHPGFVFVPFVSNKL